MSIELNPVGVKCNMQCPYCYEEPLRDAGNFSTGYDMELMKAGLAKENYRFALFGGEPLLMPIHDVEEIFRWGLEKFGSNGIQTNGSLITEEHIRIFKQYKVGVGISVDGPDELNDSRWMGTLDKTRAATQLSLYAIERLCKENHAPSIIFTLYRGNARGERLRQLFEWLEHLDSIGVKHARVHLLEIENPEVRRSMSLTDDETVSALLALRQLEKRLPSLRFDMFGDMVKLLMGRDAENGGTACIWNACDPYTTRAVRGIDGMGNSVNCGRTNKDGVEWGKASEEGFERQLALHATPQADGGCQGCKFFFACKGQCPGTAIDGDWRNRTEQCQIWYRLFEIVERDLVREGLAPISLAPEAVTQVLLDGWDRGRNLNITQALAVTRGAAMPLQGNVDHGDHWDAPDGHQHSDGGITLHGDHGTTVMHGDTPHEDS